MEIGRLTIPPAEISRIMDEMMKRFTAHLMGDGAEAYSPFPYLRSRPEDNLVPSTVDEVKRLTFGASPTHARPINLIEVDPYPIYGPARRHRRRRIQKKWLKRFGVKIVGYDYPMKDSVLIDEKRGIGYCHPHTARRIRMMMRGD